MSIRKLISNLFILTLIIGCAGKDPVTFTAEQPERPAEHAATIPDEAQPAAPSPPVDKPAELKSHSTFTPISNDTSGVYGSKESSYTVLERDKDFWKSFDVFSSRSTGYSPPFLKKSRKNTLGELKAPRVLNRKIKGQMTYFQTKAHDRFKIWMERSGQYIPMMTQTLEEHNLPVELIHLSMIESGFNKRARSRRGATGLWQFMSFTARKYGLRVDYWVDERRDPQLSTKAAARYLRDLYIMFGDWELATAGYNAGEGRVRSALRRTGSRDFWSISRYALPRETRNYVPKLYAAMILASDPERYGFGKVHYSRPVEFDTATVPPKKKLKDIADITGVSHSTLAELNPSLIQKATPPGGSYTLKVPRGYAGVFRNNSTAIASLKDLNIAPPGKHRVRRGDTLSGIAKRYGVKVSSLRSANNLRGSLIRVGKTLTIPGKRFSTYSSSVSSTTPNLTSNGHHRVRKGETLSVIAATYGVSTSTIKRANDLRGSLIRSGQLLKIPGAAPTSSAPSYTVRSGDTLGKIASRHGVTVTGLKRANGLNGSFIKPGQSLRIPSSGRVSATRKQSSGASTHTVRRGDTLGGIARKHGLSTGDLRAMNGISGNLIRVGQVLRLSYAPPPRQSSTSSGATHVVRSGDTLGGIAGRYNLSTDELKRMNGISGSLIRVGQVLDVSGSGGSTSSASTISGNGLSYVIQKGDNPSTIASMHGVSVSTLMNHNNLSNPRSLRPGQTITIPPRSANGTSKVIRYKVRSGDTLSTIARKHDVSLSDIKTWNNMKSTKLIAGGDIVIYVD